MKPFTDIEALLLSREMGYTGAALKACEQQGQAMLMVAVGQKNKMSFVRSGVDVSWCFTHPLRLPIGSCPGGGRNRTRRYMPAANQGWKKQFPGISYYSENHEN